MHIESTLSLYWVLPLVALAILVAWILYIRKQPDSVLPGPVRILLSISRLIVFVIVGLLIISPWIRTAVSRQDKPYFIVAQDNSISIPPADNPPDFISGRTEMNRGILKTLETRFQVKQVLFGSQTIDGEQCTFADPITDPGEFFSYLRVFARTHDLAGVFLTSDGVATKGMTFSEAARNFPYPVTVLGSGDSTRFPDVRIQEVVTNDWVRKNSTFPVRVYYNTGDYKGSAFRLEIAGPNGVLAEKSITTGTLASPFEEFLLQAPEKGTMRLSARIIPDQPDKNQDNNTKRFVVKVIEQEGEILCLYESAHPDIDAILQTLKSTNSLNIRVVAASEYTETDKDYDLIILHSLPSLKHPLGELLNKSAAKQIPVLFILGKNTDPILFNRTSAGMVVSNRRKSPEAAQGTQDPSFSLFTLPNDFKSHLGSWPPIDLTFESFALNPGSQILFKQKILSIELSDPLIAFSNTRGVKYGFICGEGIWRWRLHEYLEQKNHEYFDDWFTRSVQYLMLDEQKQKFRVVVPEENYAFSPARINGHLLNNSLEAINEPDVLFSITDSAGQKSEFQMARINDYYELIINGFAPGTYRYVAETKFGTENFRYDGSITMMVRPVEQAGPVADFATLRSLASATNGAFFGPGEEQNLLASLENMKPAEVSLKKEYKWYDLINLKWLLPFLLFLLVMEWFLRRWFGIR